MKYEKIVKLLRNKLFITQTDFSIIVNVSYTTVSRLETGLYKPSMKHKKKITELCKTNNIKYEEN